MTRSLLSGGVIAGAITGLAVAFLQFFLIQPLIIEAERYETGELVLMGVAQDDPSDRVAILSCLRTMPTTLTKRLVSSCETA